MWTARCRSSKCPGSDQGHHCWRGISHQKLQKNKRQILRNFYNISTIHINYILKNDLIKILRQPEHYVASYMSLHILCFISSSFSTANLKAERKLRLPPHWRSNTQLQLTSNLSWYGTKERIYNTMTDLI